MKGTVFTEFLEIAKNGSGLEIAHRVNDECEFETNEVYTSISTYSHKEMFNMLMELPELKGTSNYSKDDEEILKISRENGSEKKTGQNHEKLTLIWS
jgi:hypothetical protein